MSSWYVSLLKPSCPLIDSIITANWSWRRLGKVGWRRRLLDWERWSRGRARRRRGWGRARRLPPRRPRKPPNSGERFAFILFFGPQQQYWKSRMLDDLLWGVNLSLMHLETLMLDGNLLLWAGTRGSECCPGQRSRSCSEENWAGETTWGLSNSISTLVSFFNLNQISTLVSFFNSMSTLVSFFNSNQISTLVSFFNSMSTFVSIFNSIQIKFLHLFHSSTQCQHLFHSSTQCQHLFHSSI